MHEKNHILVVEDEQHLADGIRYNLEAEGYRTTIVSDGPAALKQIGEDGNDIALVILDIMLPGMSGYTVCERVRDQGRDVPVLILSARSLAEDRTRGFDVGADQYMTKPFDLDELLSRVKNLLSRSERRRQNENPSNSTPAVFKFAEAVIDFRTYEVLVRGDPVKLTELEMKLLKYFVDNEGRVIRREELLDKVWEMPASITTRAVDQFIRRLRKIFEPVPSRPQYFLTIRDAGYRFVAQGLPNA